MQQERITIDSHQDKHKKPHTVVTVDRGEPAMLVSQ